MLGLNLDPATIISRIVIILVCLPVHEFAHAWSANFFGDDTPRMNGRLTLNPAAHLALVGTLLLLVGGFGWARPVPINPYALRRKAASAVMWVSLAGPFSNFILAILASIPFRAGLVKISTVNAGFLPSVSQFLLEFIFINLALMLFNLIPLSPLDGEKILEFFLPPKWQRGFDAIRPYSPMILLAIVFVLPLVGINLLSSVLNPAITGLARLLLGV
jgi:Zn-dependent protease